VVLPQGWSGSLIGVRTWGGLVGIGGYPVLLDGGRVTAPRTAIYGLNGEFEVENQASSRTSKSSTIQIRSGWTRPATDRAGAIRDRTTRSTSIAQVQKTAVSDYHEHDGLVFIKAVSPYGGQPKRQSRTLGCPSALGMGHREV